ncbi:hypothetical protein M595_4834 [Lyngbya aestuarii BL J]|uniref:Uncharacterized protein n=1 Tax=Lyngbya aestuarii BL J TaxID=1348334 RepID=U7QBM0_9CYAN|nr:hypothetical protein M595_4834 [Lyngbya aestuarii BL J]
MEYQPLALKSLSPYQSRNLPILSKQSGYYFYWEACYQHH